MRLKITLLLFFVFSVFYGIGQPDQIKISNLPSLPDSEGFAGMFAGVSNGSLLCMGGANFPDAKPWEGGEKVWYDHIYVLEDENGNWRKLEVGLPNSIGYGVSINYQNQVLLIGGSNSDQHFACVIGLEYLNRNVKIHRSYPELPVSLANMSGALVGNTVFIAGGIESADGIPTSHFFALDLTSMDAEMKWEELPSWPGEPRMLSVAASKDNKFYLFSGINTYMDKKGNTDRKLLKDAYVFDPEKNTWTPLPDIPRAVAGAPNPAPILGLNHIVFPGGLDGETAKYSDPKSYPGFLEDILAYNTLSQSYVSVGSLPDGVSRVTLPSTKWNGEWIIPNGEVGPGVRSPDVYVLSNKLEFGKWNWVLLFVYLAGMLYLGYFFSKRGMTTDDYFVAGRRIPWWAAGLSIYGTQLSAITFMAIPAIVYATDWALSIGSLMILAIVPLVVKYYLPFFRRLNVISAYEYLEDRFNVKVRTLASISFILMQLARIGIVLYLPAIAVSSVTGANVYFCIAIMGVICTIYTVLGGIEAVIWTDVIQVIVLMGGATCCIAIAVFNVDGGIMEVIGKGMELNKFSLFRRGWDPSELVIWVALVSFFFHNLIPYTSSQVVVQRYFTVKDEKEAAKSLWTNGLLMIPGIIIFFGLGTTLFVYYLDNPGIINANKPDELLPYYIVQKLPVGVAGIVIAALFAASMSTLDSSMNSISSVFITDIYKRFKRNTLDKENLRLAKWITIILGVLSTGVAMFIATTHVDFIFDYFQELLGLFGGGLGGIFVLAIFTKRANSIGAITGLLSSAIITWLVRSQTDVTVYLYAAVGVISCVLIGYFVSLLFGDSNSDEQLTYHNLIENEK